MSIESSHSQKSVSEGMQYGPFAPPELDSDLTASWVMNQAFNDPYLYQLLRLKESLKNDNVQGRFTNEFYDQNLNRLDNAIGKYHSQEAAADLHRLKSDRKFVGKERP